MTHCPSHERPPNGVVRPIDLDRRPGSGRGRPMNDRTRPPTPARASTCADMLILVHAPASEPRRQAPAQGARDPVSPCRRRPGRLESCSVKAQASERPAKAGRMMVASGTPSGVPDDPSKLRRGSKIPDFRSHHGMVPEGRLELPCIAAQASETCVSTNSTTRALTNLSEGHK